MHDVVGTTHATERLSDALRRLLNEADGRPLMIREMVEILPGRGLQFVVILLCLPFLTPVTLPGISMPFGLAIALCGVRIAFGHKPWLPAFILNRRISYSMLKRMVLFGCKIYEKVEKVIRPRLAFFLTGPGDGNGHWLGNRPFGSFSESADTAAVSFNEHDPWLRDYFPLPRTDGARRRIDIVRLCADWHFGDLRHADRPAWEGGS